jgi:hypothetical protein
MIKCNIKRDGHVRVKASGTAHDLTVETSALIEDIYQSIHQQNPEAAKGYKNTLIGILLDPNSPVWKEPNHGK